jgi:putative ABC transport system ATP-binding protein
MSAAIASKAGGVVAQGLTKRFKTGRSQVTVLKGVDFEARPGEVTMVMGPSPA